jgi:hypothetical protein
MLKQRKIQNINKGNIKEELKARRCIGNLVNLLDGTTTKHQKRTKHEDEGRFV